MSEPEKKPLQNALVKKGSGLPQKGSLSTALTKKDSTVLQKYADGPAKVNAVAVRSAISTGAEMVEKMAGRGICFVIDATGSREASWREAQSIQARMFSEIKEAEIGIVVFNGAGVRHLGYFKNAESATSVMRGVDCRTAQTDIARALGEALTGANHPPASMILVGDCCEEHMSSIRAAAEQVKAKGIKVHTFLEGDDSDGRRGYQEIADITGGLFQRFGSSMGVALSDIASATVALDTGGIAAFNKLLAAGHKGAQALLPEVQRKMLGAPK